MYDLSILPSIGRSGLRNSVRVLTGMQLTGWRSVNAGSNFLAGQLGTLITNAKGEVVVVPVAAVANTPVGMFFTSNATSFYRPIANEAHAIGEDSSPAGTIVLNKSLLKTGSVRVAKAADNSSYEVTTNYTVNDTNGIITNVNIPATTKLIISYMYKDVLLSGVNQVLGSGKAALVEGVGEISTLVYDTTATYALGGSVYFTSTGLLSGANTGSAVIGGITKTPTLEDPSLHVKLNLG